ncbi:hypothetical protein [Dactylosporangium salmoneum]|uniref:Uncharacterized protein n=1 Tax=Dactylosporangium salmoneum TaxID=53361 RepID=A0ABN3FL80_9ACTN
MRIFFDRVFTWARTDTGDLLRHARPLHGILGWWASASFGLLGVLLAALWPMPMRALGPAVVGAWLLCTAFARLGGTQLLRACYGGLPVLLLGAALPATAGIMIIRQPDLDSATIAAAAALAFGIPAAVDGAVSGRYPRPARDLLRVRAAAGIIAAIAVPAAPVAGIMIAAAAVGLADLAVAARLMPEVQRLADLPSPRGSIDLVREGSVEDR